MKRCCFALLLTIALIAANTLSAFAQFPGAGAQRAPAIAVDRSDNLYLLMSVATKPASERTPGSQIFFTRSLDGGTSWDNFPATRNLSNSDGEAFGPSVAVTKVGKPKVYVVYHDNEPGVTQAFLIASKKGTKFKKPRNITPHDGGAFAPRIALDSEQSLNIVWGDTLNNKRVVFTRSTDAGGTFTDLLDISRSSGDAFEPEIAVGEDDAINVSWEDNASGSYAIMYSRSSDGGATFSTPIQVSKGTGNARESYIAAADGLIHVVWVEEINGSLQAMFARSTDHGKTFSTPLNLTNNNGAEIHKTSVVAQGNTVYVAFNNDESRSHQAYIMKSSIGGQSFDDPVQISNANASRGRAHSVAMVIDSSGTLHTVWIDTSVVGDDEGLLYYRRSTNGRTFSASQLLLALVVK